MMQIVEVKERTERLIRQLLQVWERSMRATHDFLPEEAIGAIGQYVPQALRGVEHLVIAKGKNGRPAAFMGIEGQTLAMLFLAPEERGKGMGKRLLQYGAAVYGVDQLTVKEQNPQARGFYEHLGFEVYKRSEQGEQGGPYPILYLRRT